MTRRQLRATVPGGELIGWVEGDGPPLLLLHGGPGFSYGYLDQVAAVLGAGYQLAAFQQRGLAPSTVEGPFTIDQAVADVVAVLDALGWDRAYVLGHSWGGHLLLHLLVARPDRLLGALAVDPLGGVGDGGMATMAGEMGARVSDDARRQMAVLEGQAATSGWTDKTFLENLGLVWPAYFAVAADAPSLPGDMAVSVAAYIGLFGSLVAEMPALAGRLPAVSVPVGFVAGAASPLPADEGSVATAAVIPGAFVDIIPGAGHLPWHEHPQRVRAAAQRLVAGARPENPPSGGVGADH